MHSQIIIAENDKPLICFILIVNASLWGIDNENVTDYTGVYVTIYELFTVDSKNYAQCYVLGMIRYCLAQILPIPLSMYFTDATGSRLHWCHEAELRNTCIYLGETNGNVVFNSLWLNGAKWRHKSLSILTQGMACCLPVRSYNLNQCSLIIGKILWHSRDDNFTRNTLDSYLWFDMNLQIIDLRLQQHD